MQEYITRSLERKFAKLNKNFKCLLVTGARQVGKTTMLEHLAENTNRTFVSLDDEDALSMANQDPALFLQAFKPPVLIDEIQKAPKLFPAIKAHVDKHKQAGQVWMTGSQQFLMMKNIQESLAGRVAILNLHSFSQRECATKPNVDSIDLSFKNLSAKQNTAQENNIASTFEQIWTGGMPSVQGQDAEIRSEFFKSYVETYLMRDVSEVEGVRQWAKFRKFLVACASITAEQLNYAKLAEIVGITQPTAKQWIDILVSMGIIFILAPYKNNRLKRLTKTPKLYFADTGLCAYLAKWPSAQTLMAGPMAGHYFENFVVSQLMKNACYSPYQHELYYYRDWNGREIDLIIDDEFGLHPFEIKLSSNPKTSEVKKFSILDTSAHSYNSGGLICMCQRPLPIDGRNAYIPSNML